MSYGNPPIKHGTMPGYYKELRLGIPTCASCKRANRDRMRQYLRDLGIKPRGKTKAPCGTNAGYQQHVADGTTNESGKCGCREAASRTKREYLRNARNRKENSNE